MACCCTHMHTGQWRQQLRRDREQRSNGFNFSRPIASLCRFGDYALCRSHTHTHIRLLYTQHTAGKLVMHPYCTAVPIDWKLYSIFRTSSLTRPRFMLISSAFLGGSGCYELFGHPLPASIRSGHESRNEASAKCCNCWS